MHQRLSYLLVLSVLFSAALSFKMSNVESNYILSGSQTSANFNEDQLTVIRSIIHKAQKKYSISFETMSSFIWSQMNSTFGSHLNVLIYRKQDLNASIYMTGLYDQYHQNKRYFQAVQPEGFNFSVLIVETNNTVPYSPRERAIDKNIQLPSGLTFTKRKSPSLTTAQEAGIDLAMTTAYTWNKNIVDFTNVLHRLTETNLNQRWQILTRFQKLDSSQFGFTYSAVYGDWIEYLNYGLGSYVLRVYLYRNSDSG